MGSERVPKRVRRCRLGYARSAQRFAHCPLERLVAHVMASLDTAPRVGDAAVGRKHVLPTPVARSARILALERVRQPDGAKSVAQIRPVHSLGRLHLPANCADETIGKHRDPVLGALAVAHEDRPPTEIDVLHPQPNRFHDAHARAVQQFADEPVTMLQAPKSLTTSGRVSTAGNRGDPFARTTPSSQLKSWPSASRYRNSNALCA